MRLRHWLVCFLLSLVLGSALGLQARAAIYSAQQALTQQAVQGFLANPSSLLDQYPNGGGQMIARVRDLVASDPATLNPVVGLLPKANVGQSTAIGTGLGQAALMALKTDQTFANQIQQAIAVASQGTTPAAGPATGSNQTKIGSAIKVKDQVDGSSDRGTQPFTAGSELYLNQTVRTGATGKAEFLLLDRTNITLGPTTELKLDQFNYDPLGGNGSVVLNVKEGSFRFITGVQPSRDYEIKTPYGTIGVRGTEFVVVITPTGLEIQVISGEVVLTGTNGQQIDVTAGMQATVNAQGVAEGPVPSGPPLVDFADLGQPTTELTLADALAAFSAVTGNTAITATGGGGGAGGGGTGGGGGSVFALGGAGGGGGGGTTSFPTFVVNTPGNVENVALTSSSPGSTSSSSSQSVSAH